MTVLSTSGILRNFTLGDIQAFSEPPEPPEPEPPSLDSLSPNTVVAGSPDLTITFTGAGFTVDSQATFDGEYAASTTFVNDTTVTGVVLASKLTPARDVQAGVTNGPGLSAGTLTFTIT